MIKNILSVLQSYKKPIFFVNIGAHDGKSFGDPLYDFIKEHSWQGICVEPNPVVIQSLQANFLTNKSVSIEQSVISSQSGAVPLYLLSFCEDWWATALASLSKNHILHHEKYIRTKAEEYKIILPQRIEDWYKVDYVNSCTYEQLLKKYNVAQVDVVHIDAEGYDFEVIKTIKFEPPPLIIHYEHKHLGKHKKLECVEFLQSKNYRVFRDSGPNDVAIHRSCFGNISCKQYKKIIGQCKMKYLVHTLRKYQL